jgi:hypothetical protein
MAAPLLLLALLFLVQRRTVPYVLTAVLCASLKEEVGLAVAMTGLYAWARCGRRTLGIVVALASLAWVGLCVAVIIPRHAGGAASPFLPRYQDALTQLTAFLPSVLTGSPASPVPEYALRYTLHMVASAGVLAVLAPLELAIAAPLLAINGLSASNWQHGGGAHYSSEVAGPLLVAGIAGCRRTAAWLAWALAALPSGRGGAPPHTHTSLALVAPAMLCLAVGMTQSAAEGVLPPAYRFTWPEFDARAAYLQPLLHRLPPDASVSAQSNLVPHVSRRARVYVFPTVADAQFVLLDVIGTSAPLGPDALYDRITALLSDGEFKVLAADHGFLLLERGAESDPVLAPGLEGPDPDDVVQAPPFLAFVRGDVAESLPTQGPVFGDLVELVGQRVTPLPAVNLSERRATVELSLRVKQPTEVQLRFVPFLVGAGGAIRQYDVGNSAQLWFPTSRWKTNDVVRVRYPPFAYVHGDRLALGVTAQGVMLRVDLPAPLAGTPYQRPSPTPSESSTAPDYRGLVELAALP